MGKAPVTPEECQGLLVWWRDLKRVTVLWEIFSPKYYKQTQEFIFTGHEVKGSGCSLSTSNPGTNLSCSVTLQALPFCSSDSATGLVQSPSSTDTAHPNTHTEWMVVWSPSKAHKSRNRIVKIGVPEHFFSKLLLQAAQIYSNRKYKQENECSFFGGEGIGIHTS